MICFKGKTFCINAHCTCPEDRQLTDAVLKAAKKWWGREGAPIAMADLCGAVGGPGRV